MSNSVPASISEKRFSCPHCGAFAHQYWYDAHAESIRENGLPSRWRQEEIARIRADTNLPPDVKQSLIQLAERSARGEVFFDGKAKSTYSIEIQNLSLSQCYSCGRVAVWVHDSLVYPPARWGEQPNADLPLDVCADYEEARSIVALSPRGAAALLRLCIQKLCEHLGENGKLDDAIAALVKKGLDPRVQKALDIVRVIGNESVHPGQIDLRDDPDTATELFRLVNLIVEVMISQPKHINAMYSGLPESKRLAIEKRDKETRSK